MTKNLIYIGRSRLHRNRANLIQTLHTVAALQRIGVDVTLLLPPWDKRVESSRRLREIGIDAEIRLRTTHFLRPRLLPRGFPLFCWLHRRQLTAADMVYCRSPQISRLLALSGIRHAFEVHNAAELSAWEGFAEISRAYAGGVIAHLVPISHPAAEILVAAGLAPERMCVAPSGVDLGRYRQLPPFDFAALAGVPNAVYLGRISNSRGLAIFAALAGEGVCKVELIGDQEDPVPAVAGLSARPFVPPVQVPECYARADVVLLPYQAGLEHGNSISPLKLYEAMAAGRPVIASDLPSLRAILKDGDNALLVEADDPKAWAAAIRRLQAEQGLARRLAEAGKQLAAKHDWESRAKRLTTCFGWDLSASGTAGNGNRNEGQ